jgi:hypothetical protein
VQPPNKTSASLGCRAVPPLLALNAGLNSRLNSRLQPPTLLVALAAAQFSRSFQLQPASSSAKLLHEQVCMLPGIRPYNSAVDETGFTGWIP